MMAATKGAASLQEAAQRTGALVKDILQMKKPADAEGFRQIIISCPEGQREKACENAVQELSRFALWDLAKGLAISPGKEDSRQALMVAAVQDRKFLVIGDIITAIPFAEGGAFGANLLEEKGLWGLLSEAAIKGPAELGTRVLKQALDGGKLDVAGRILSSPETKEEVGILAFKIIKQRKGWAGVRENLPGSEAVAKHAASAALDEGELGMVLTFIGMWGHNVLPDSGKKKLGSATLEDIDSAVKRNDWDYVKLAGAFGSADVFKHACLSAEHTGLPNVAQATRNLRRSITLGDSQFGKIPHA